MSNYTKDNLIDSFAVDNARAIKIGDDIFVGFALGGTDVSATTADSDTVLSGFLFYNRKGVKVGGKIPSLGVVTYIPTTTDIYILEGQYLAGKQIINGDTALVADNIARGKTIFGVEGTYFGGIDVSGTTATAADVLAEKKFYNSAGVQTAGTIQEMTAGDVKIPGTTPIILLTDKKYIDGNITIAGDANLLAKNIRKNTSIFGVAGTVVLGIDVTRTTLQAAGARLGKAFYSEKGELTYGTMGDAKLAAPLVADGCTNSKIKITSRIATAGYAAGDLTRSDSVDPRTICSYLLPLNIKKDVTIFGVTGTYSGPDMTQVTAAPADVLGGKYFYTSSGALARGNIAASIPVAPTILADNSSSTITAVYDIAKGYVSDSSTMYTSIKLTDISSTLKPLNIKNGIKIFGITGTLEAAPDNNCYLKFKMQSLSTWPLQSLNNQVIPVPQTWQPVSSYAGGYYIYTTIGDWSSTWLYDIYLKAAKQPSTLLWDYAIRCTMGAALGNKTGVLQIELIGASGQLYAEYNFNEGLSTVAVVGPCTTTIAVKSLLIIYDCNEQSYRLLLESMHCGYISSYDQMPILELWELCDDGYYKTIYTPCENTVLCLCLTAAAVWAKYKRQHAFPPLCTASVPNQYVNITLHIDLSTSD